MANWLKSYELVIGSPEWYKDAYYQEGWGVNSLKGAVEIPAQTIPADVKSMSNLTVKGQDLNGFEFTFTSIRSEGSMGEGEKTKLSLVNINEETIEYLNKDKAVVFLWMGYDQDVKLVYSGSVESITVSRSGSTTVHSVILKDGGVDLKNTKVSASYSPTTTAYEVIKDLAGQFPDVAYIAFEEAYLSSMPILQEQRKGGWVFLGDLKINLDKMLDRYGLIATRYNGKITIRPKFITGGFGSEDFVKKRYTMTADSIKAINPMKDNSDKEVDGDTPQGVVLTTFLIPEIELDNYITIPPSVSSEFAGTYRILTIKIDAASKNSNKWDTILKLKSI